MWNKKKYPTSWHNVMWIATLPVAIPLCVILWVIYKVGCYAEGIARWLQSVWIHPKSHEDYAYEEAKRLKEQTIRGMMSNGQIQQKEKCDE